MKVDFPAPFGPSSPTHSPPRDRQIKAAQGEEITKTLFDFRRLDDGRRGGGYG